jgi:fluoride exporter
VLSVKGSLLCHSMVKSPLSLDKQSTLEAKLHILLLIFLGGGIGSIARYGMMQIISRTLAPGAGFPWHTLGVNIIGAFAIGMLIEILALRISMPSPPRFFLITGFLGGFTTFSAFSMETALMLERGDYLNSGLYVAASVIGTVAAVFIGSALVRAFS